VVAAALFACDQGTKFLAVKHLTHAFAAAGPTDLSSEIRTFLSARHPVPKAPTAVVPAFWSHRYAENRGAAFSLGAGWADGLRGPFFALVPLLAMGLIVVYFRGLPEDQRLSRVGLSLLLGGAAGNLADRALRGYVIDFVDWHWNDVAWAHPARHWATFNVADAGICLGVGLLLLESALERRRARPAPAPALAPESAP
jgi:signal peptidase II